jgi:hypothetical protein
MAVAVPDPPAVFPTVNDQVPPLPLEVITIKFLLLTV